MCEIAASYCEIILSSVRVVSGSLKGFRKLTLIDPLHVNTKRSNVHSSKTSISLGNHTVRSGSQRIKSESLFTCWAYRTFPRSDRLTFGINACTGYLLNNIMFIHSCQCVHSVVYQLPLILTALLRVA